MINPRSRVHIPTEGSGNARSGLSVAHKGIRKGVFAKGNARGGLSVAHKGIRKGVFAKGNARGGYNLEGIKEARRKEEAARKEWDNKNKKTASGNARGGKSGKYDYMKRGNVATFESVNKASGGKGLKLKAPPKKAPPKKTLPIKPEKNKMDFGKLMKQAEQAQKAAETAVKVGKMVKKMVKKKNNEGQEVEVEEEVMEGGTQYKAPVKRKTAAGRKKAKKSGKPKYDVI
jgi:hypothetical protein